MKIKALLIFVVFFTITVKSQIIKQGIITYEKSYTEKFHAENKNKHPSFAKFKMIEEKTIDVLKSIRFKLKFTRTTSTFSVVPSLIIDENMFSGMALIPEGKGQYYNDENNILSEKNIFGENFLITDEPLKWVLKNETKKIGDYLCYKATAIERKMKRGGMKEYPVIAWYCPEINTSFGPVGLAGLPGLILEVNKGRLRYTATKINLNPKKNIKIAKITKGKKVTRKEMNQMLGEAMGNFKKNKGY
ncbi:GLPGLI family protein [Tenacibaculum finnmarkense]|uniref:GLPGLI family protein n=1 Tax=Tenacibaculum finnmarkense TaxID=2781243 RepID=UPI001EFB0F75|nr:GLPGLI family protein [Tenacibaculum finnmarkense]MCG8236209.1 GLPGLI family protein [Tenacibaculum finnmarkense genomovar ulcerans]MCG8808189.1 GLPGLI family protein [Tenacibaculum finnmarkense]MCG8818422.1 GLPGLI family protein [Tenacibaculum finnmarkense]MCG8830366.1 GLPGLI family protein [Tenacibaculum finnmarkense]